MLCKTRRDVMKAVKERNVSFIQIWFTDVLGYLKSFAITTSELEEALEEGMGFDGSSIEGFARIEESDMIAKPDPTTFEFLPWRGIEFRSPDPACNPYLAFSVMLAAGLKGIEGGYPLPEPIEADIYHFSPEKREELNIQELPGSLNEAISEM
jgi:glutamine synthetase